VAVVVPEDRSRTPSPSPPPTPPSEELSPEELKKIPAYKRPYVQLKKRLQSHRIARQFFPPKGNTAVALTLVVAAVAVFIVARSVLGPIAGPGGAIFSLMILILLCLIAGQIIKIMVFLIFRYTGIQVRCPPFLGMLVIGIILKNVPYNFGQFGRADCYITNQNNTETQVFVDSINQLEESRVNSLPLRRKRSSGEVLDEHSDGADLVGGWEQSVAATISRQIRSSDHDSHAAPAAPVDPCKPRFIGHDLDPSITVLLRSVCLTVILLMAGLELDPVALQKLAGMVVSATVIPCLVEACIGAILSHFILGFDWMVGFILGFLLTGVSPAVIIPSILSLSSGGYGLAKGIPTLTIAVCSADDVFAIAGFGIVSGLYFNPDASLAALALQGPIEIIIGVVFGFFWGTIAQWLPNKDHHNVVFFRWVVLFSGGLISIFGAHLINYEGAGGLACIIGAFLAGKRWRAEGWGDHNPITKSLQKMWIILGPVIFGLIGTEIQINKLDGTTVGYGIIVLLVSLLVRMLATYFSVHCGNLNLKERIFMACAWVPKATVQAALGEFAAGRLGTSDNTFVDNPENYG
jgi:NhaP-type Na+/H+ or K+/H+ antiporter